MRRLNEELSTSNYMTGVVEVGDAIKMMLKTKESKDTIDAYNFALEVIEKLQTGSKKKQKRALIMLSGVEASGVERKRGKSVAGSALSSLILSYKQ